AVAVAPAVIPVKAPPRGMADWEHPDEWHSEAGWMVHKGGNFVLFGPAGQTGTFTFSAVILKGRRLQWLLNFRDQRNYALFQIEKRQFSTRDVINGSSKERSKGVINSNASFVQISIALAQHGLTTSVHEGDKWRVLDTWMVPDLDLTKGKFGFLIPGSDQVGL